MPKYKISEIKIKRATEKDIDMLADAEKLMFSDFWSRDIFFSSMQSPWIYIYIIYYNKNFAGYAVVSLLADVDLNIDNIAILPQFRRKGLAEYFIKYIINNINIESVMLEVRESNTAARSLYEKLGFYINGRRKKYYTKPNEDAILMRKDLK